MITLTSGRAWAEILPDVGGGLAGLAGLWLGDRPVLRPCSGRQQDGPFGLACNLPGQFGLAPLAQAATFPASMSLIWGRAA